MLKVNGKAVTPDADGTYAVSGVEGARFIFRAVEGAKEKEILKQEIFIFKDGPDPAFFDIDKGEQVVSKPVPVPNKGPLPTSTGAAPTAPKTADTPAVAKTAAPAAPTADPPKPKIENKFD
jgi:hypothetical protein